MKNESARAEAIEQKIKELAPIMDKIESYDRAKKVLAEHGLKIDEDPEKFANALSKAKKDNYNVPLMVEKAKRVESFEEQRQSAEEQFAVSQEKLGGLNDKLGSKKKAVEALEDLEKKNVGAEDICSVHRICLDSGVEPSQIKAELKKYGGLHRAMEQKENDLASVQNSLSEENLKLREKVQQNRLEDMKNEELKNRYLELQSRYGDMLFSGENFASLAQAVSSNPKPSLPVIAKAAVAAMQILHDNMPQNIWSKASLAQAIYSVKRDLSIF